jgi:23S rRNA (adenine2503-C2)-methyltransferase
MELLGKSKEELRAMCAAMGQPPYRGAQLYHALYAERRFDLAQMSNLPAAFRAQLAREATITLPQIRQKFSSADGSIRYLFGLDYAAGSEGGLDESRQEIQIPGAHRESHTAAATVDSRNPSSTARLTSLRPASVEAVFMPSQGRQTVCVSTQAGCAVDCQFCLTAQLGLIRNLTPGEILAQLLLPLEENRPGNVDAPNGGFSSAAPPAAAEKQHRLPNAAAPAGGVSSATRPHPIQTNVVLMGQGEPLLNFDSVIAALRIMFDAEAIGLSPKHVTLSTSGIVPGIHKLAAEKVRPKLAISLNASNDEQRDVLMPINKKYPLKVLLDACRAYPLRPWEHLTFEYVMLGGVNDSSEDARRVVRLLAPLKSVKVNLIPWNPGELPYRESSPERIEAFRRILTDKGVPTFVRYSRGRDVMAACGQLALLQIEKAHPATPLASSIRDSQNV